MSDNPMRILVVEPAKDPYVKEIDGSLQSMQELVGGYIETVFPFEDPETILVCNEEGKLQNLPENRFLRDSQGRPYDLIRGTFFFAGVNDADLCSLTDKQIQTYTQLYRREKLFVMKRGRTMKQAKKGEQEYER